MCNTQVTKKEQLEKNPSELILSVRSGRGTASQKVYGSSVPPPPLSSLRKALSRIHGNRKEGLGECGFPAPQCTDSFFPFD